MFDEYWDDLFWDDIDNDPSANCNGGTHVTNFLEKEKVKYKRAIVASMRKDLWIEKSNVVNDDGGLWMLSCRTPKADLSNFWEAFRETV